MLSPSVVNIIDPDSIRPGDETSRNVDMAVTLLPQPLSPTKPSVFLVLLIMTRHQQQEACRSDV